MGKYSGKVTNIGSHTSEITVQTRIRTVLALCNIFLERIISGALEEHDVNLSIGSR